MKKIRPVYGVISASTADTEQREILKGVIEKAQELNIDIAVMSNIYNPSEASDTLKTENKIYSLILSEVFDGFILISEAFINKELQQQIISNLIKKKSVPVIAIGTPLPDFVLPDFKFINNSDENDMEDITNHLIEVHGMTDIDMLTGHINIEASHKRIEGYRRALEKHGIKYNENKVFFGDFWFNSGKEQAGRYISGELPYPQALICANDYMAYGFLDEFMEQSIPLQEKITVIGYEYISERYYHTPLLTTYQRNRRALGREAVRLLSEKISETDYGSFTPPKGKFIYGNTCRCGESFNDIKNELQSVHIRKIYEFLNLFCQLENRLTECRNIKEFLQVCRDFQFMVRDRDKLYLCLYENWYEDNITSENMICYNLLYDEKPVTFYRNQFSAVFSGGASPYYFCPLFFSERELGYVILKFDHPDTFDHIFRNWLKIISNSLEFLRMKNDIRYLTECNNLSEYRDTLTNMYNENGLKKMFVSASKENLYFVSLRICVFKDYFSPLNENEKIRAVLDVAEAIHQFSENYDICAKIKNDTFICLVRSESSAGFLVDKLMSILYQHTIYMKSYGMDLFLCFAEKCGDSSYMKLTEKCNQEFEKQLKAISLRRQNKHYKELIKIRKYIYLNPEKTFNGTKAYEFCHNSMSYLRTIYKKCFGISFHQDCIAARIAKAKYYLIVSSLTTSDIAEKCGYLDSKYFMRQFIEKTGLTTNQYKNKVKELCHLNQIPTPESI